LLILLIILWIFEKSTCFYPESLKNPLSFPIAIGIPREGKDDIAPSPLGEVPITIGREGGSLIKKHMQRKG
jgi:hypothetical protein